MSGAEGMLDYGSGRYKLVGRPGHPNDYYFHAGDWLEMWIETRWVPTRIEVDRDGRWYFLDADGTTVIPRLGMKARLMR